MCVNYLLKYILHNIHIYIKQNTHTHTCALLLPPYSVQCGEGNLSILWWGERVQMRGETEAGWGVGRCCHTPALSRKPQLSLRPPHNKYYSTPPSLSFLFHCLWESSSQTPTQVLHFIFFFFSVKRTWWYVFKSTASTQEMYFQLICICLWWVLWGLLS